ncbi:MAG: hypothetical protein JNM19_05330 [Chitinophagaceae bacterium]|nr:hypothetical protein [Chitinophagaceae bacterium]
MQYFAAMYSFFRFNNLPAVTVLIFLLLMTGCASKDKQADTNQFFFDYTITGEEENDSVTIMLQYREEEAGEVVSIEGKGQVKLDGIPLLAESTKITGAYYEVQRPLAEFAGNHTIIFTTNANKEYKEEFTFQPLQLLTTLPDSLPAEELVLELNGVEKGDLIRILMTDTIFGSEGIERLDTIQADNRLLISREEMTGLASGPIQLELVKESEDPIQNATPGGGRLYRSFRLKREFWLVKEPE